MRSLSESVVWRTVRWCAALSMAVVVAACGGGDDQQPTPAPTAHEPAISNLRYAPSSVLQSGGGTVTITGTFDFSDAGGDITSMRMTTSAGADVSSPTPQLSGVRAGTATGQVVVGVGNVGRYTFEFWVTDSAGRASNRLSGTFEVVAATPALELHGPAIADLIYSPTVTYQSAGATIPLSASIRFTDPGGDMVALRFALNGVEQVASTTSLAGVTAGTASGTFQVAADRVGLQQFSLWAVDGKGVASNRVSGSFEVLSAPVTDHTPLLRNLRLSTSSVYQTASIVPLSATVDFADPASDIALLRVTTSSGVDLTQAWPLPPTSAGTATTTFTVPAERIGKYTVQLWVVDKNGTVSLPVAGSYEVLPLDTWTRLAVVPPAELYGIAQSGGRYVAVGAGGTVMSSSDLVSWNAQSGVVPQLLRSVAASASRFVAVGDIGRYGGEAIAMTSEDGVSWTVRHRAGACDANGCAMPARLSKVIWTGTQFVAVGEERTSPTTIHAVILTSPDGLVWTQHAAGKILVGDPEWGYVVPSVNAVAWSGTHLLLYGLDWLDWVPKVWSSNAQADVWTLTGPLPEPVACCMPGGDLTWGNGRFVIVGAPTYSGHSPTFISTDGNTWQTGREVPQLPPMSAIAAGPGQFVAVSPVNRQVSADGLSWTVLPMTGCGNGVTWDGTRYVSVGQSICRSP